VQQIQEARRFREGLKAAFIINRKIANTAISRQAAVTLAQFDDLPVLATALNQRVVYAESAAHGLAVIEVAPDSEAAREMGNLVQQILVEKERRAA
jgi:chromosome partitioning protein